MPPSPQNVIARQVLRVRRRLWAERWLHGLLASLAASFLAALMCIIIHHALWGPATNGQGWLVLGLASLSAVTASLFWAWQGAPGIVDTALAIDQRFALKERVATYCSLSADQAETPVGLALLEDVRQKLSGLQLGSRFPIRVTWPQVVRPTVAVGLALLAYFFCPRIDFSFAVPKSPADEARLARVEEAKRQLDNLHKDFAADNKELPLSKEERDLDDKIAKMLEKSSFDKNEVRDVVEETRALEDQRRQQIDDLKKLGLKQKEVQAALEKLDDGEKLKDGPGKEFEEALAQGDTKKAADEIEVLRKKLKNNDLNQAEQKQLADRLDQLERRLHRLRNQQDLRDQLDQKLKMGELTKERQEQLARELNERTADLADLKDLAELLGDLKKGLREEADGNAEGDLKDKLDKLQGKLGKLGQPNENDKDLKQLMGEQGRLEARRLAMLRMLEAGGNQGAQPSSGARPAGAEPKESKSFDAQVKTEVDRKRSYKSGYFKGGTFSKIPAEEVSRSFQQAHQDASQTLDRQRVPADVADIMKGYFQNLGGQ